MKSIVKEALRLETTLTAWRRRLHGFAECGFDLSKTREFVKNTLQKIGYEPKDCGKAGIVCELSGKSKGPFILLRADMDALPIAEMTRLPFRAENGHAHACGHDMHTAMLLGAAALLKQREQTLPSPVRFAFQGAEELLLGARDMKGAGVLTDVGTALMIHVIPSLPFPTGTVLFPSAGVGAPAATFFSLTVTGKSAHVGTPEKGQDALSAAIALYEGAMREAKKEGGLSLTVGKWTAGDAPNVVADKAVLEGSFRAYDASAVEAFRNTLRRLCAEKEGECGVKADVSFLGACPPLRNDGRVIRVLQNALGQTHLSFHTSEARGGASEDFAVFAADVPAVAVAIAAGQKDHGYEHSLHHPCVLFDEAALPYGAAVYAAGALALGEALPLQTFTSPPLA